MSDKEKTSGKSVTSRRNFLKQAGGAAAAMGLATSGLMMKTTEAGAAELPKKWDQTADVIVIGSGFAGLAAALEAKKAGAKVIILEKMPVPGGNSIINGGLMAATGSPLQDKEGIKDSPELMFQDMLKAGLHMNHPELAMMVSDQSLGALMWTLDYLNVDYKGRVTHLGGHSVPRSYLTNIRSGAGIVRQELKKVKEEGIPLQKRAYLEHLIMDGKNGIVGVEVLSGYAFPKAGSGKRTFIKANQAVIMANGGFSYDVPFRMIQDPRLDDKLDCTNHPGATAEGLIELLRIGATPVQPSWIQLGPWGCPQEKGMGIGYIFAISGCFPFGIMVDPKTGKRFVNELADRKVRADAIIKTGHWAVGIADTNGAKYVDKLDKMLAKGTVRQFNTLDELAQAFQVNSAELQEQVKRYNAFLAKGKDEEFGKPLRASSQPIAKAPFYGMNLWPKVHHTMGGVQINSKAQLLDLYSQVVPGLYAAGEVTGGVHGAVRLGSNATTDCLVFGRIAGANAAKERPRG
ncbi:MAG: flavocytochrome c [Proteobacteria bacterium]|nr:flavocytochrome c [Pseudomonadota bacterium]MBU4383409.1 flavocytochrome c [Pseudomonadota bacterium]MBU4603575.1 flavocytochrome c [Pseudomonadota bacterium]MCG2763355.1 flavocytochrome c [Desulfarculaceae bacterium]